MKIEISEARFYDLVYLTLKKLFFEPAGLGNPRECDIRVCMNLVCPEMVTSPMAMILLPNEVAPKDHAKSYLIETDEVFANCISYLEDHWMKQEYEGVSDATEFFNLAIVPCVMRVPEEQCGVTNG